MTIKATILDTHYHMSPYDTTIAAKKIIYFGLRLRFIVHEEKQIAWKMLCKCRLISLLSLNINKCFCQYFLFKILIDITCIWFRKVRGIWCLKR